MSQPNVVFIPVSTAEEKRNGLSRTVQQCFSQRKRILVLAPNREVAQYVDQLLWRHPPESFVPHTIAQKAIRHPVVITTERANLNRAQVIFNLSQTPLPITAKFETIYELYDTTSPQKEQLSRSRKAHYASVSATTAG